jgi:hypothetical protein
VDCPALHQQCRVALRLVGALSSHASGGAFFACRRERSNDRRSALRDPASSRRAPPVAPSPTVVGGPRLRILLPPERPLRTLISPDNGSFLTRRWRGPDSNQWLRCVRRSWRVQALARLSSPFGHTTIERAERKVRVVVRINSANECCPVELLFSIFALDWPVHPDG